MDDFCVFILSHARVDRVFTHDTLRKLNYTGKIFIIIDDTDKQQQQYIEKFGADSVLIFSKDEIAKTFDAGDNFPEKRAVVYARNACFDLAKKIGFKYFMQLDDDYTDFRYSFDDKKNYVTNKYMKDLNAIFKIMLDFYKSTSFTAIAMAQGGDFISGEGSRMSIAFKNGQIRRKCMNSFLCSTERPFNFIGRINEDVNAYVNLGNKGELFLTIAQLRLEQKATQSNAGGLTDIYLSFGTYVKSFYSVMYNPSCVSVRLMGSSNKRLHHSINWDIAVPKIIDEKFKKC